MSHTIKESRLSRRPDPGGLKRLQDAARARGGECLSTVYTGTGKKYLFRCKEGHEWEGTANNFLSKHKWCRICVTPRLAAQKLRDDGLQLLQEMAKSRGGELLCSLYRGMKQKYNFKCQKGHRWLTSGESVFRQGTWCPKCKGAAIRNSKLLNDGLHRLQTAAEYHGGSCLTTVYTGIGKKYLFRCQKGHEWEACGEPILAKNNGTWCPHCSHSISRPEKELQALVQALLPDTQILFNSRQVIKPQELDIYVPSLKKALEFDGDYWHSSPEAQNRDAKKNVRCKRKGIQLMRVLESDWSQSRQLVEQQVRAFLSSS